MTPAQIEAVKQSWTGMLPLQDKAASMFYGKLLELDLALQVLLKDEMVQHGGKLISMIANAVNALDRLETLVPALQSTGVRYAAYGVRDADYAAVRAALLWTLQTGLGDAFTTHVEDAWTEAYGVIAMTMQHAAREAATS